MARCHPFIRFSTPVTSGDSPFQGHADHASQVGRHRCCGFSRNLADACGAALMRLVRYYGEMIIFVRELMSYGNY